MEGKPYEDAENGSEDMTVVISNLDPDRVANNNNNMGQQLLQVGQQTPSFYNGRPGTHECDA